MAEISEDDVHRLEQAALITQHQLVYAKRIISAANITSPEITAAIVQALATNYAAQLAVAKKSPVARRPRRVPPSSSEFQIDLLTPDPFDPNNV